MFVHRHQKSPANGKSGKEPKRISHLSVFLLAGFIAVIFTVVAATEQSSSSFKSKAPGYSDLTVSEHT
ncbi:MAG TPA: hypothetical protein PLL62_05940, partial [Candidatus Saccharicenans sp.]|nr:hypothetical protein [Candidatus Saccharicenans sp.]